MAINQGEFGTCVSHALVTVVADQLFRRYRVAIDAKEQRRAMIMAIGEKWDGANTTSAINKFNQTVEDTGYFFNNTDNNRLYKVRLTLLNTVTDFNECQAPR